jgi:hypothetical protein
MNFWGDTQNFYKHQTAQYCPRILDISFVFVKKNISKWQRFSAFDLSWADFWFDWLIFVGEHIINIFQCFGTP